MKTPRTIILATLLLAPLTALHAADTPFDPCRYGAVGDGKTLCTEPIQKAVDACAAAGGGTVRLAGGTFLSGTIYLRSHVTLEVAGGATLLGSTNIAHYPVNVPAIRSYTDKYVNKSLIAGENLQDIGLTGRGTIDGQGSKFGFDRKPRWRADGSDMDRPFLIRLVNCRDVLVEGLRLQDSAAWLQHYLGCERVMVRGIHVWNYKNQCNDGIDLDGCKDCVVSGSVFESDDDGITLKSTFERPSENITISDCVVRSHASAIKMGTESSGGFRNITIANCVVTSPPADVKVVNGVSRGLSGVALEMVDGGVLENITVSNIAIEGVTTPIFLRLGNRARLFRADLPKPGVGTFRNVVLSNIVATRASKLACSITGIPGHPIENVQLSNIQIACEGGGTSDEAAAKVPESEAGYPECTMFGKSLPAYGFYFRQVQGLRLSNVRLETAAADLRHALVFDDVENLALAGLDAACSPGGAATVSLIQTRGALISGCQPRAKDGAFVSLSGERSRNITLVGNDLSGAARPAAVAPEVPKDALLIK
jgi:polygalacturonase